MPLYTFNVKVNNPNIKPISNERMPNGFFDILSLFEL